IVLTTSRHYEPSYGLVEEVAIGSHRTAAGSRDTMRAARIVRAWCPQVVLEEQTGDARFLALASISGQRILLVHDAVPHDATETRSARTRLGYASQWHSARLVVTFSQATAHHLQPTARRRSAQLVVWPLLSEYP